MITDVMTFVREYGMEHLWFQQDGELSHIDYATIDFLLFPDRLISKSADLNGNPS